MAAELLVGYRIDDGKRIVDQLIDDGFEVTVALWVKVDAEGPWHLYIASPAVKAEKPGESYPALYLSMSKIPDLSIEISAIKLINNTNPIARGAIELSDRQPARIPTHYVGPRLGNLVIEEAYIYPPPIPKTGWPRLYFTVTYYRQDTDIWRAATKRGDLYRGINVTGAISYSTALRGGEGEKDITSASVSVLLEIDPSFDDKQILEHPDVKRMMVQQARSLADEMFKSRHPAAVIEHDDQLG
jgi:hypothetical protein